MTWEMETRRIAMPTLDLVGVPQQLVCLPLVAFCTAVVDDFWVDFDFLTGDDEDDDKEDDVWLPKAFFCGFNGLRVGEALGCWPLTGEVSFTLRGDSCSRWGTFLLFFGDSGFSFGKGLAFCGCPPLAVLLKLEFKSWTLPRFLGATRGEGDTLLGSLEDKPDWIVPWEDNGLRAYWGGEGALCSSTSTCHLCLLARSPS